MRKRLTLLFRTALRSLSVGLLLALAGGVVAPSVHAQIPGHPAIRDSVRALLARQEAAWNQGDLEAFMAGYARTDTLRFASGGTVRTGWMETLARYRRSYPDTTAMGTLSFGSLDLTVLSPRWVLAFGRWRLQRAKDAPHGLFTLLLHRPTRDAPWRIVHDHTSSAR